MEIKDLTLHLSKKIQKRQFEPLEASFGLTVELEVGDGNWEEEAKELWQKIKKQVEEGLDEDSEDWIEEEVKKNEAS